MFRLNAHFTWLKVKASGESSHNVASLKCKFFDFKQKMNRTNRNEIWKISVLSPITTCFVIRNLKKNQILELMLFDFVCVCEFFFSFNYFENCPFDSRSILTIVFFLLFFMFNFLCRCFNNIRHCLGCLDCQNQVT